MMTIHWIDPLTGHRCRIDHQTIRAIARTKHLRHRTLLRYYLSHSLAWVTA